MMDFEVAPQRLAHDQLKYQDIKKEPAEISIKAK
jgi:hypothetical protein